MSPLGKAYIEKLYAALSKMPEQERLDAVREIESHIEEGISHGQREADILAKLGDPSKLAKAFRSEHFSHPGRKRTWGETFAMIGFYCTTGLLSVMIVPVLATIAYGFGFCTVLILLAGIIRSFGATWINMDLGPYYTVPTEWSMAFSLVVGGIVGGIAYISRKYLRKYLRFVSERYQDLLPADRK
ncbi:HAAS domain-containing protein [Paenibacillus hodogayensis]|uniref:HAAS domain-containing protein n=1 Tax=Paenibacillus hodogayensis TaxID=279208 RepID=A0ABV5W235_9BACL